MDDVLLDPPRIDVGDDTTVLWQGRPSQYTNVGFYVACTLPALLAVPVFMLWPSQAGGQYADLKQFAVYGLMALLVFMAFMVFWCYLVTRSTSYRLTAETLTVAEGVLQRDINTLETFRVKDLSVHKSLLQRLVGIGDLQLDCSDRSHPTLLLKSIRDPEGVLRVLRRVVSTARQAKGVREID